MKGRRIFSVAVVGFAFLTPVAITFGQGRNETIAESGQAAPDGNGFFSSFFVPVLNDSGELAFAGLLNGTAGGDTDGNGIFRGSGGSTTQVARAGQVAPDGNGTFETFSAVPSINNSGQTGFIGVLSGTSGGFSDNLGIFMGDDGNVSQIARKGQDAPDSNGVFLSFGSPVLNDFGAAAFRGSLSETSGGFSDDQGIFSGNGGNISQIVREGQLAPDANGTFLSFTNPVINNSGQTAFRATLTGTSGNSTDSVGIFRGSGGNLTQIARAGQGAPDANGVFSSLNNAVLNDSGQVAFIADFVNTNGGTNDDSGIFRGSGGGLTQIVRKGQVAPDGNGTFVDLRSPSINTSGQVAFLGYFSGTSGGLTDERGVFRGSGGSLTQIARSGKFAPNGNGTFSNFGDTTINDAGQVAFIATLGNTSGGIADDTGIFIGDGSDLLKVAREGDSLAGNTIVYLSMQTSAALNSFGQIAYLATLNNGEQIVSRWTPDLHWRTDNSGNWGDRSNWTLSLDPAHVHDVFIDPDASLIVNGPTTDTTVRRLFVGTDGVNASQGLATLNLQQGRTINVSDVMIIGANGTLTGDGRVTGTPGVINDGRIIADNIIIDGPINSLTNGGVIEGNGRVHADIFNVNGGSIRANNGNVLSLTGPSLANSGLIEVLGGELQISATVQNDASSGLIVGRDATMRFNGGLNNSGAMAFSFGNSEVFGDINNTGVISIDGGSEVTFFDDITQNGSFEVVATGSRISSAVVLGDFSGSGGFTGGGDVFLLGDLRPGNSPDSVLYDGNLFLGSSTGTYIELGGVDIGDFDQMLVSGDLNLAGDLFVSLIDGHTLGANQFYMIGDVGGNLLGQFSGLGEGSLVGTFGGRDLFITYGAGDGNDIGLFTAVPEPNSAIFVALLGLAVLRQRRPKHLSGFDH
ncbi:MAG: hypothetical protein R3C03_13830 [Pirellulaceae bacterium]